MFINIKLSAVVSMSSPFFAIYADLTINIHSSNACFWLVANHRLPFRLRICQRIQDLLGLSVFGVGYGILFIGGSIFSCPKQHSLQSNRSSSLQANVI